MSDIPHYEKPEHEQAYYKSLKELLDHYEDGWNFLINAHKEKNYDYPLKLKEEHKDNPYLPKTWLELCDRVCQIIAKEKYELDVYPNEIQIIRSDQMLDAYTTNGVPGSYSHWSFGKSRLREERNYDQTKHLAYEIVINSNACVSYCMDTNSPLLQLIVIAHAAYGHNAVFKNNAFLKEVGADTIIPENSRMREFIFECEEKYGWKEVSDFLDFCHAMKYVDVTDQPKRDPKTKEQILAEQRALKIAQEFAPKPRDQFNDNANDNKKKMLHPQAGEKNILLYMADNAPHLPQWKRDIMRHVSRVSQYFRPQMMTKVLNEGMATFIHDRTMQTLADIGMIDFGMLAEYKKINHGVLFQQPAVVYERDEKGQIIRDENGFPEQKFVGADFNPYMLGFSILEDVVRICKDPTDEDREWFHFAGNPNWLPIVKHAIFNSFDETYIEQYLSPKVMRDLRMFTLGMAEDQDLDEEERMMKKYYDIDYAMIKDVQTQDGFRKIRAQLARDNRITEKLPSVAFANYQEMTDRCLILHHHVLNDQRLDPQDTQLVLELMHNQWKHPVVIESIDEHGKVLQTFSSPQNYDYKRFSYTPQDMGMDISVNHP
ncbi:MAG: SpoVR family protein [Alphaproteobacteria bacterium]